MDDPLKKNSYRATLETADFFPEELPEKFKKPSPYGFSRVTFIVANTQNFRVVAGEYRITQEGA